MKQNNLNTHKNFLIKKIYGIVTYLCLFCSIGLVCEPDIDLTVISSIKPVKFKEFKGLYSGSTTLDTEEEIRNIGRRLGTALTVADKNDQPYYFITDNPADRYSIIRIYETGTNGTDLFIIGKKAGVDTFINLSRIISGYLETSYHLSVSTADEYAKRFIWLNAEYHNKIDEFPIKFSQNIKKTVKDNSKSFGISTIYNEWAGNTCIAVPHNFNVPITEAIIPAENTQKPQDQDKQNNIVTGKTNEITTLDKHGSKKNPLKTILIILLILLLLLLLIYVIPKLLLLKHIQKNMAVLPKLKSKNRNNIADNKNTKEDDKNKKDEKIKFLDDYTVIDTETTGFGENHRIIEIAAIRVRNGNIDSTFQQLIKPIDENGEQKHISNTKIHGITDDMVKNCPTFKEIQDKFIEFIGDDILIGHNLRFDLAMLKYDGLELPYDPKRDNDHDTCWLAKKYVANLGNYKLITLVTLFNIADKQEHRALSDAKMTFKLYEILKKISMTSISKK